MGKSTGRKNTVKHYLEHNKINLILDFNIFMKTSMGHVYVYYQQLPKWFFKFYLEDNEKYILYVGIVFRVHKIKQI